MLLPERWLLTSPSLALGKEVKGEKKKVGDSGTPRSRTGRIRIVRQHNQMHRIRKMTAEGELGRHTGLLRTNSSTASGMPG